MGYAAIKRQLQRVSSYGEIFLFGSTARNEHTEDSDIDIAILVAEDNLPQISSILKSLPSDVPYGVRINERYGPGSRIIKLDINIFTSKSPASQEFFNYPHPLLISL